MAGRVSLLVGFSAMLLSTLIGTLVGVTAGYRGGWIGAALMRMVDGFLSFPSIFLVLALAATLRPSPMMITVIIAVTSWMEVARIVEAEVRSLREREFVQAARMVGLSGRHIMFREILPNAMGPIIVAASLDRRPCHSSGGLYQFPRLRHPAAAAQLGQSAQRRPAISGQRSLACHHSRCGDYDRGDQFQFHRRRAARCA